MKRIVFSGIGILAIFLLLGCYSVGGSTDNYAQRAFIESQPHGIVGIRVNMTMEGIKTKDGYRIPTKRFYIELNENLMLNEKYTPSYSGGTHIMGLTSRKLDYHYDLGWAYPVLPGRVSLTFAADSRTIRKFFTIEANETIYFEFNGNELIQKSQ